MRNIICFCLTFLLAVGAHAQSAEEKEVLAAAEALNKALITPNKQILENLVVDELSYGHSSGKIQDKTEFIEDLLHGTFDFLTVSTSDQTIKMAGKNAIVRHVFTSKYTNNGVPGDLRIGNLLIWKKERGKWKLLARQAFKI